MRNTKVILLSSKARYGKDTTAGIMYDILTKQGKSVLITHFADPLKMLCANSYGWTYGDKGPVGRTILQNVGTEYRSNNYDCWANIIKEIILGTNAEYVLVPDCRYHNEVEVFNDMDRTLIRIERPNFDNGLTTEQKAHISENDLDEYKYDYILINDGTIEDLKEKVIKLTQKLMGD